jgi:hypothetical protein
VSKHYVGYGIAAVVALAIASAWLRAHDAWKDMQADIKVRDAKIQQNTATEHAAQSTINQAQSSNTAIDAATKLKLDGLQAQLNSKPDSDEIRTILQQSMPALKGVSETKAADGTAMLSVADTQENRDIINRRDADFKACVFNRDDCEQKQQNYLTIIAAKDVLIKTKNDTISEQGNTIKEMSRFGKGGNLWSRTGRVAIPIACAGFGAWSAAQANAKPKTIGIAAAGAGAVCGFTFHF